jgi:hypothetical protein
MRKKLLVAAVGYVIVASQCHVTFADIVYTAGPNQGSTPQEYFFETANFANPNYPRGYQLTSHAEPFALHAKMGMKGSYLDNFFTAIDVRDLIFTSADPNATSALVRGGGNLEGGFDAPNGSGTAILNLYLNGAQNGLAFSTNDGQSINQGVYVDAVVPLNTPIRFAANLELRMSSALYNTSWAIFDNSFRFDPNQVFELPVGVTVNSVDWGVVDNRLSSPIPEPAASWLLPAAFAFAAGKRGRCRADL